MSRVRLDTLTVAQLVLLGTQKHITTDSSGRAVYGVSLWPLGCWNGGFETRRGHGCLSVVSVVCCQAEISAWD